MNFECLLKMFVGSCTRNAIRALNSHKENISFNFRYIIRYVYIFYVYPARNTKMQIRNICLIVEMYYSILIKYSRGFVLICFCFVLFCFCFVFCCCCFCGYRISSVACK